MNNSLIKVVHIWKKLGDKRLKKSVHKCKLIGGGHYGGHLGYQTKREFDKSNPYIKFGGNRVIND